MTPAVRPPAARRPVWPVLMLAALAIMAAGLPQRDDPPAPQPAPHRMYRLSPVEVPLRIEAVADGPHWWFRYADHPRLPAARGILRLPAGRTVQIVTRSAGHSQLFWVPHLGGKVTASAVAPASLLVTPRETGLHAALCDGPCDLRTGPLPFVVEVMPAEDFHNWIGGQP